MNRAPLAPGVTKACPFCRGQRAAALGHDTQLGLMFCIVCEAPEPVVCAATGPLRNSVAEACDAWNAAPRLDS